MALTCTSNKDCPGSEKCAPDTRRCEYPCKNHSNGKKCVKLLFSDSYFLRPPIRKGSSCIDGEYDQCKGTCYQGTCIGTICDPKNSLYFSDKVCARIQGEEHFTLNDRALGKGEKCQLGEHDACINGLFCWNGICKETIPFNYYKSPDKVPFNMTRQFIPTGDPFKDSTWVLISNDCFSDEQCPINKVCALDTKKCESVNLVNVSSCPVGQMPIHINKAYHLFCRQPAPIGSKCHPKLYNICDPETSICYDDACVRLCRNDSDCQKISLGPEGYDRHCCKPLELLKSVHTPKSLPQNYKGICMDSRYYSSPEHLVHLKYQTIGVSFGITLVVLFLSTLIIYYCFFKSKASNSNNADNYANRIPEGEYDESLPAYSVETNNNDDQ